MSDSPTPVGARMVVLNQRSATAPYHREAVEIDGDEHPGKALGFDDDGLLGAIEVGAPAPPTAGFNVKSYGALGNNTGDDAPFIQAAVDAAETAGGGLVIIPCGTYRTVATVTIGGFGVTIAGESAGVGAFGPKGSVISYQGTAEAFVIGDVVNDVQYGHGIRDLSIMGTAAGRCGVRVGALLDDINNIVRGVQLHNVCIRGFTSSSAVHSTSTGEYSESVVGGCGLFIHRGVSCLVTKCDFMANWIGVIEASCHRATTYSFIGCWFHDNLDLGLRLCSSVSPTFRDCIWENNQAQGVLIKPYTNPGNEYCSYPAFLTCYWEHNGVAGDAPIAPSWNLETSGAVIHLIVRDANMGSSWDDRGGVRIGDGALEFRLDNVILANGDCVAISTHANATGLVIGPPAAAGSTPVQGTYVLGAKTIFLESVEGQLRLHGHMIFSPDNTHDIGLPADNQPRVVYARKAVFNNPDTNQLTLVNSVGKYCTLEVNLNGTAIYKAYGVYPYHLFYQSIESLGDLESSSSTKGLILKSPNGHRWRFTVNDAGALSAGADLGT